MYSYHLTLFVAPIEQLTLKTIMGCKSLSCLINGCSVLENLSHQFVVAFQNYPY